MNQVNNLIQWKNLTQEQKDEFDFENYSYEVQKIGSIETGWFYKQTAQTFGKDVYRLVIEPERWYAVTGPYDHTFLSPGTEITLFYGSYNSIRPARPDEIPVAKEKTLEQKIQEKWPDKEVVILSSENGMLRIVKTIEECEYNSPHIFAKSMKGFYKYVYEQDNDLIASLKTLKSWKGKTLQPVAVLFER